MVPIQVDSHDEPWCASFGLVRMQVTLLTSRSQLPKCPGFILHYAYAVLRGWLAFVTSSIQCRVIFQGYKFVQLSTPITPLGFGHFKALAKSE